MVIRSLLAALLLVSAAPHPLHTTFTEIVEDPVARTATVVVRSFSDDLARAIAAPAPSSGAPTALPDSALAAYVRDHLALVAPGGKAIALHYTGQRQSADITWIAFAIALPAGLTGTSIADHLQGELYADQVNLVQVSYSGRKATLLFSSGDAPRTLP